MKFLYNIFHKHISAIVVIIYLSTVSVSVFSQHFYNNGGSVIINNGAWVIISGDYLNHTSYGNDGTVNSNGTMIVQGDWVNNANNTVFPGPGGETILNGTLPQSLMGSNNTTFENLTLQNSDKILDVTDNSVQGVLALDAVLNLNKNTFIIDNPNSNAIKYKSKYILSETFPGSYGYIRWNIGSSVNTYEIPFGTGNTNNNDLNLTLTTTSAGNSQNGFFSFATYPTDDNNYPLPTGVTSLDKAASYIADRYWIIDPNFTTNPNVDLIFRYTEDDINPANNPNLKPELMKGESYCTTCGNSWKAPGTSSSFVSSKTVAVSGVKGSDCYAPWRLENPLSEVTIYIPNAFTPGNNGLNDSFGPIGDNLKLLKNYSFIIFNRLGGKVFESTDINIQWDGRIMNDNQKAPQGVYAWIMDYVNMKGDRISKTGNVTLLPEW